MGAITDAAVRTAVEALVPAEDARDYAATTAVNLVTDGGSACRRLMPLATGNLVITTAAGNVRTLAVTVNVAEDIRATAIGVTNAIPVRAYW
jgi:hypothetical protein